ncbi:MAG: methionyl-tRNA formyltransferase [Armatimonadota bacterium]|nr:methionyl-tRNA formyltransferase [Armatimonadota bacterium]
MRIIFMGTPEFAVPTLDLLVQEGFDIRLVVTQPDRPAQRGLRLSPPPVKAAALKLGLPVFQPEKINSPESLEKMRLIRPDVLVVVAFGRILRSECLSLAPLGAINAHPSLLPRYRGPAPIQHALLNGDSETGVTTIFMDERMDAGDIILQKRVPIFEDDDCQSLSQRLSEETASLMVQTLRLLPTGHCPRIPQDDVQATYAPILPPSLSHIDFSWSAKRIVNLIRALSPQPGAHSFLRGKRIKFLKAKAVAGGQGGEPGQIISVTPSDFLIATGEGSLRPLTVQTEGRRPLAVDEWLRGMPVKVGEKFE